MTSKTRSKILLTNDDGIESPGLAAVKERLSEFTEVTIIAPKKDRSGVGRLRSQEMTVENQSRGIAVTGTPADCVTYGLRGKETKFDLIVSGCNNGPNVGSYFIDRSGTVGAALEAAFLGKPAIAVSTYHKEAYRSHEPEEYDYSHAADTAAYFVRRLVDTPTFKRRMVLNVNVPVDQPAPVRLTYPLTDIDVSVTTTESHVQFEEQFWGRVGANASYETVRQRKEDYEKGSDRRAMIDGEISVTPLNAPGIPCRPEGVKSMVQSFNHSRAILDGDR